MNSIDIDKIKSLIHRFCESRCCNILLQKDYEVLLGIATKDTICFYGDNKFDEEHIIDIRVFDKNGELHIWKINDDFYYRFKEDNFEIDNNIDHNERILKDKKIFVEYPIVFGSTIEKADGKWTILKERERGIKIYFPYDISWEQLPIRYKVYNYYDFDEDGILRFYDARLCGFFDKDFKELESEII
ncbi:CRISPR-associated protein Csx19 [Thermoanaerobacterium sp. RBIITD]|uniref:type III-D CRISPR-associated protein Csx19 n=1 Tax=Thermoanaerobacterium sp. RBIITD TaxID=1550240 RepID=UPI000BB859F7|nr:CRISPR-associated protein Csx19 [Thermoanaerobacterium sp. RBIITD]SNX54967.1 CRISPR-associated protein, TIGR03984 family [Thermoanaerobacterium sp. RBIITD]